MATVLVIVPVRLRNDRTPFLLALKAIALPTSFINPLSYPLFERSKTLRLLDSPNAHQNYRLRQGLRPGTLFNLINSMLELILIILKRDVTV